MSWVLSVVTSTAAWSSDRRHSAAETGPASRLAATRLVNMRRMGTLQGRVANPARGLTLGGR